jgi:hypothetical protein
MHAFALARPTNKAQGVTFNFADNRVGSPLIDAAGARPADRSSICINACPEVRRYLMA